jgi:hypothetical protein
MDKGDDEEQGEKKMSSARTGTFWFTETEKAYNYRIGKLIVGIFSIYLSLTVIGIIFATLSFYYFEEPLFYPFITVFVVCLCSYVPFVFLYFRFTRLKRLEFYSKGVKMQTILGRERFLPYRSFRSLKKRRMRDIGKAYHLVPRGKNPSYNNIVIPKKVEGSEEFAEKIKDAIER